MLRGFDSGMLPSVLRTALRASKIALRFCEPWIRFHRTRPVNKKRPLAFGESSPFSALLHDSNVGEGFRGAYAVQKTQCPWGMPSLVIVLRIE